MKDMLSAIEGEWRRYQILGDRALQQVRDDELARYGPGEGNSVAVIVWHIAGNHKSRFTDFLTSDGEKPWRHRDSEFLPRDGVTRAEVMATWNEGWRVLFDALEPLTDDDLSRNVVIRGELFRVHEALLRLLAHTSYHVGQIVYLAKSFRGNEWEYLTIPPGKSEEYNRNPAHEKAPGRR
jgi:hypothetical protein